MGPFGIGIIEVGSGRRTILGLHLVSILEKRNLIRDWLPGIVPICCNDFHVTIMTRTDGTHRWHQTRPVSNSSSGYNKFLAAITSSDVISEAIRIVLGWKRNLKLY